MSCDPPVIAVTFDFGILREFVHWRQMLQGIVAAGAAPLTIDCSRERHDIERLVGEVDGLIIGGGPDVNPELYGGDPGDELVKAAHRSQDDNEQKAFRVARERGIPVLAICRGAQLINVTLGGKLYADLQRDRAGSREHLFTEEELDRARHSVDVAAGSLLSQWMNAAGVLEVNSGHHQGICTLAPSLTPTAIADDGLIEAFELPGEPLVAVQWHPEVLWRNQSHADALMRGFVASCRSDAASGQAAAALLSVPSGADDGGPA